MLFKRSAALKIHRKMCMVKCTFSKATSSRPKVDYPAIKEMLAILAVSFFSGNVFVYLVTHKM